MTQKEMDRAQKTLPPLCKVPWDEWTAEQKQLYEEISCRSMINSCLVYGGIKDFWYESPWRDEENKSYADRHVRALGLERVKELIAEQEADFAKATVYRNVYTDYEGVTYNSIVWADDLSEEAS